MKEPTPEAATTSSVSGPMVVVVLVVMLGATIYLWRNRYMRRRTAYVTMSVLVVLLIVVGLSMNKALM
jgi:hypothetical protein